MTLNQEQVRQESPSLDADDFNASFDSNNRTLTSYYQLHSQIYDWTRWSFLFGRDAIVKIAADIAAKDHQPKRILEVGCGTGKNLRTLHRHFPHASLVGLDLSADMLNVARKNMADVRIQVDLLQGAYGTIPQTEEYDLILFSYALTMFNPGWDAAIEQSHRDLAPGGLIAVVDFHDSALKGFKRWMGVNHVRMDSHLPPKLEEHFAPQQKTVKQAYGGIWSYLLFVGQK
ncbi:MAG: class I SAM-dependent methyltransferase [Chloroflexota bacterium]